MPTPFRSRPARLLGCPQTSDCAEWLDDAMSLESDYVPSPRGETRDDVEKIEEAGDTDVVDRQGRPVVLVTMRGARTGALRKVPLMRVEHEGCYALVASQGGAPTHPVWYHNLTAHPEVDIQDGPAKRSFRVREVTGEEKAAWWDRAVAAFPDYADYQERTDREIPLLVAEPI